METYLPLYDLKGNILYNNNCEEKDLFIQIITSDSTVDFVKYNNINNNNNSKISLKILDKLNVSILVT